jgi:hypothetical protein
MKKLLTLVFLLFSLVGVRAQQSAFDRVRHEFDNFQHDNVLKFSDPLLQRGVISDSLLIEVYMMRSIAYYMKSDETSMRKSFESILGIKRTYTPDPALWTPAVIRIFNEVKAEYLKNNPVATTSDSLKQKPEMKLSYQELIKGAMVKNLLLPGLGQFHFGETGKGLIFSIASALNLGVMVYFISDAKKKENNYENETDPALISQKYDDYNKSYQWRNTFIISYAVIWLYSQIDLLFMSDRETPSVHQNIARVQYIVDPRNGINVGFSVRF